MRNEKLTIQTLQIAKGNAVAFYEQGDESQDFWKQIIDDCNDEIIAISQEVPKKHGKAVITVVAGIALFLVILWCAGCGEIIQSAGHLCNAGGQALSFTGDHLTQTVAKEK